MREKKQSLRVDALVKRESLAVSHARSLGHLIQERVLRFPLYLASSTVALYSPIGNEVATDEIRDHALGAGKKVFYPKVAGGGDFSLIRVRSAVDLAPGRYGILEPGGSEAITAQDEQALVVFAPGLAFDIHGRRLGRGKGGYDRILGRLAGRVKCVALAYECQIVEDLPTDSWDQRVHYIITERRTIDCGEIMPQADWTC
jgi:5-formyltetrahydrofolate cyclo-ligase